MHRRKYLTTVPAVLVGGCVAESRGTRECPELENVEGDVICSNTGSLYLEIEPSEIEIPETATFTITNDRDHDFTFQLELPYVYRKVDSDWKEDRYFRWRRSLETITVKDQYSYEKEVPFGDGSWDPGAGDYLVLVPGWKGDPNTPAETVLVGDFIKIIE